jgi:hypothetical protein
MTENNNEFRNFKKILEITYMEIPNVNNKSYLTNNSIISSCGQSINN